MLLSQGSIPIRVNGRDHTQFYSQTQKGSLSGRRLCIACKPVKDGYDGQVSYCAGTDRLYPAKRGIGVGVSAKGKIDNFMKSWRQKSRTERNENFFEEMEHNLFLLMKQMEKNENGGYQLWNR